MEPTECVLTLPELTTADALELLGAALALCALAWGTKALVRFLTQPRRS